jgi:MFS transporter, DHA1 family, inner membrane transport protein
MTAVKQSYQRTTGGLLLLALALFVAGTNAFVIAGLLPDIARSLDATPTQVSYSITSYALLVAVASPVVSIALARVPRSPLMAAGLAVFALGTAISAAGGSLGLFFTGRTLSGLGAAAFVPTATASAAALAAPERRGRALAVVGAGFTLATAVGSPLGTALGSAAGWQLPLWLLVGTAAALAAALPLAVREIPLGRPAPLRARLAPLAEPRVLAPLAATLLMVAGFNTVYIFSSTVTAPATGGSGSLLAVLLLCFGAAGVVGNLVAGPAADRFGNRRTGTLALVAQAAALGALAVTGASFTAAAIVFAVWGVAAFASTIAVQHRLVEVDPGSAAITLSWYSTAMYLGIAVAPPLAAAALATGGPLALPLAGALATLVGLVLFARSTRSRPAPAGRPAAPAAGSAPCR